MADSSSGAHGSHWPGKPHPDSATRLPLHGIRVLDFSTLLPGPLATLVLTEAGAEVLRIEPPGVGDPLRAFNPALGAVSALYAMLNAGKRVFGLDLGDQRSLDWVHQLADEADIVVVQARPGVPERQGIGYAELSKRNPRLVYCSITGYGSSGALANRPGYDLAFMADSGLLGAATAPSGGPVLPATSVGDIAGGTYPALVNILLALRQRDSTGQGTFIEISMAHNLQALTYRHFARRQVNGAWGDPDDDLLGGGSARYHLYPTADRRFVAVYALNDWSWDRLGEVVGLESPYIDQPENRKTIEALTEVFVRQTAAYWRQVFESTGVKATVVSDFAEAERAGLIDVNSPDRVRCGQAEVATLPSIVAPALRRAPGTLDCPGLEILADD
jgi:alpha-methylacyl-CoA racemase